MPVIDHVHFLIHGFCYAEMAAAGGLPGHLLPFLEREMRCARAWRSAVGGLGPDDLLAVVPWPGPSRGPVRDFVSLAASALGDRFLLLDAADDGHGALGRAAKAGIDPAILRAFAPSPADYDAALNREELDTGLHCAALAGQFLALLAERGHRIDPGSVASSAWGASFDGCVTKYSLYLRRLLGWARPVAIAFDLTVPDAHFALGAHQVEVVAVDEHLRAHILQVSDQYLGLFTDTGNSLHSPAAAVRVPLDPDGTVVLSKQGIRLWPAPEVYVLRDVPAGYEEEPQTVVAASGDCLVVPVSAGLVYRLARAPAYLLPSPGVSLDAFRARLRQATRV